jgi:hypothetical protein
MGHRALIAYERPDSLYNVHYTHWGGFNLRLKHDITPRTPFGADRSAERAQTVFEKLVDGTDATAIDTELRPSTQVDVTPRVVDCTLDELFSDHLHYLKHEACYVVADDFSVTAYRTHWLGLEHASETITDSGYVGNGALRTVRWNDGVPVGDGFVQGQFEGLKSTVGDMVDRGVFDCEDAVQYMVTKLRQWTGPTDSLLVYTSGVESG